MRRLLRRLGTAAAALVLVALVALTAVHLDGRRAVARASQRFTERIGPLDVAAYAPAPVPPADNAAAPLLEVVARMHRGPVEEGPAVADPASWLRAQLGRVGAGWSAEESDRVRHLLSSRREILRLLHRGARRPAASFGLDYAAGSRMEIPPLLLILQAVDLLHAEAAIAWRDHRPEDAAVAVESLAAVSRALEAEAPLIFPLVGWAVEAKQATAIQDGLALGPLPGPVLRRLRASVAPRPRRTQLGRALGFEGSLLATWPADAELSRWQRLTVRWLLLRSVARGLTYHVRLGSAWNDLVYRDLREHPERLDPPRRGAPAPDLVPDLEPSLGSLAAAEDRARLARLALDVALAAARQGAFPPQLPDTPEAAPGRFTGTAPVYERAADGSARLSLPGADELWRRLRPRRRGRPPETPFTWRLAPPRS